MARSSHSYLQAKSRPHHLRATHRKPATPCWRFRPTTLRKPKHAPARDGKRGTSNGVNSSLPPCRRSQRRIVAAPNAQPSRTPRLTGPPKRCSPSVEVAARAVGPQRGLQQSAWPNQAATQGAAKQPAVPHAHAQNAARVPNQRLSAHAQSVNRRPPRGSALLRNGSPAQPNGASRGLPHAFKRRVSILSAVVTLHQTRRSLEVDDATQLCCLQQSSSPQLAA
jgi:hypothetical protein